MNRTPSYRFPRAARIRRRGEFRRIFADGRRRRTGAMLLITSPNELGRPRLGVSVPKRFGNAPARNRIKRKIREAFRLTQHELGSVDIVCIPKPGCRSSVADIRKILIDQVQ